MKVFLTGSTGFIGSQITRALRKESSIELLVPNSGELDLLDDLSVDSFVRSTRPDILIHTAWFTSHGAFWDAPENLQWYNSSCHLFENFYKSGGKRILSLGTCAEYCWKTPKLFYKEDDFLDPVTKYGLYKKKCMMTLMELSDFYGGSFSWARIFYLFGKGENLNRLIPSMINSQVSQSTFKCSSKSTTRDFSDVSRIGNLLTLLALSKQAGPINVASGIGLSIEEIELIVNDVVGGKNIVEFATLLGSQPPRIVADVSLLKSVLGEFCDSKPKEELRKYCETFF